MNRNNIVQMFDINYKVTRGRLLNCNTLNINNRVIEDYKITSFNTSVL